MFFVTTEPAPINAYCPISFPQTIVAFASIEAPFFTVVLACSAFRFMALLEFITFVKTIDGPKNTSSSHRKAFSVTRLKGGKKTYSNSNFLILVRKQTIIYFYYSKTPKKHIKNSFPKGKSEKLNFKKK